MSRPFISVVIPCYNYGRFLGECVSSVLNQLGEYDLEVIAIDDASTDDTQAVLRGFKDSRLKIVTHVKNQGHVVTINEGLSLAQGDFICRIDADDRLRPIFFQETLNILNANPDVGAVYGCTSLINETGATTLSESRPHVEPGDRKWNGYLSLLGINFICAPTLMARRETWKNALPIQPWMTHSDWFLNLGIARQSLIYFRDAILADYRVHKANHHSVIIRNRTEEETTLRILNHFIQMKEASAWLDAKKMQLARELRARHFVDLSIKYYGYQYYEDSRRCFIQAVNLCPRFILNSPLLRAQLSIAIGPELYNRVKSKIYGTK